MDTPGRDAWALRLAEAAGRSAGLDCRGRSVLRAGSSVLVVLPGADVIARVEAAAREEIAWRQVHVARAFAQRGAPTMRLAAPDRGVHVERDGVVTLWRRIAETQERPARPHELGVTLRAVHDVTREALPTALPRVDPPGSVLALLDSDAPTRAGLGDADMELLRGRWAALARRWAGVGADPLGARLLHGDVHTDNVILAASGPVLIDLEYAGVGPASWDFVPFALHVRRYGCDPADFERFAGAYGADPRQWSGFELAVDLYELLCATWASCCHDGSARRAAEGRLRLDTLRGRGVARWTLL